jgi:hypothetical protein
MTSTSNGSLLPCSTTPPPRSKWSTLMGSATCRVRGDVARTVAQRDEPHAAVLEAVQESAVVNRVALARLARRDVVDGVHPLERVGAVNELP